MNPQLSNNRQTNEERANVRESFFGTVIYMDAWHFKFFPKKKKIIIIIINDDLFLYGCYDNARMHFGVF